MLRTKETVSFIVILMALMISLYSKLAYKKYIRPPSSKYVTASGSTNWFENCNWPTTWSMTYTNVRDLKDPTVSKLWCVDRVEYKDKVKDFCSHMALVAKSENHDGLVAMNFGIPYRIMYLRSRNITMINPKVEPASLEKKDCVFKRSPNHLEERKRGCATSLFISYYDITYTKRDITIHGRDVCTVEALIDELNACSN
jgi:hypothetical protein